MSLRLAGSVCDGAGAVNEDRAGYLGDRSAITAAWVLDGVTGINKQSLYPAGSDAAWFVQTVDTELKRLLVEPVPLPVIMSALVDHLVSAKVDAPPGYDPPACCLLLAREHEGRWDALRIGDSSLLVSERNGTFFEYTEFPLQWLDRELKLKTEVLRRRGLSQEQIVHEFRPMILEARQKRNRPGGYGILEADPSCLQFVQYIAIEDPRTMLLCTDGFYRLVENYRAYDDESLLAAAANRGPESLLAELRTIEAGDPECRKYPRFKPRDDAAAVCLISENWP